MYTIGEKIEELDNMRDMVRLSMILKIFFSLFKYFIKSNSCFFCRIR